ncbi:hypothetical protein CB0940_10278 [Cercospora beticola]|uniref:RING-type domain-containing protein n=1 Tax=Cercospora beticola TaxID=122368 RepID=A0A2G5HUH0_CERBT|nr:hypothetical protein CB0940_10278 [Cercospora beticola]PIA95923.1 hypothetical protein CB0940_10278 [Cercospora beticola]WPB06984.1 hypothetical protein RHO25_011644 [Cercospora beticola]CAK1366916.1 unnamed protein product [Cercospora beticola]
MSATCAKCEKPLEVEVNNEDFSDEEGDISMNDDNNEKTPQTVPDDVLLSCGDHFHWECLLESYEIDTCPKCSRDITTGAAAASSSSSSAPATETQILVDLNNEGGLQHNLDIFPILKEESYLRAYPEERKCRAFLEFCREGDHRAIADLIKSCSEPEEDEDEDEEPSGPPKTADEILRYQDPIGDMQSGLHAAVANGHREVAWLLLLLASEYPELEFPALVFQEAASLGLMREEQSGKVDIRSLKDAHGRTAEDVAQQAGIVWHGWIGNGRLAVS